MKKNLIIATLAALLILTNAHRLKPFYPLAVSNLPESMSCQILINLTNDTNPTVSRGALYRLGKLPNCNAENQILAATKHFDANTRHNALNALNKLGKSSFALDSTIEILNNPCEKSFVHSSAIDLIKKVKSTADRTKAITALENFISHTKYETYKSEAKIVITKLKGE